MPNDRTNHSGHNNEIIQEKITSPNLRIDKRDLLPEKIINTSLKIETKDSNKNNIIRKYNQLKLDLNSK